MPALAIWQWALGATCAALIGVAKTGVPGVGILVVPLMVFTAGQARASAGWLLPLLCVAAQRSFERTVLALTAAAATGVTRSRWRAGLV